MSAQMNFRSAFNGFNREDVVHYIEYLNTKHTAEINQLNSELDYLRSRQTQVTPADTTELDETIAQQAARIRELFDRCKELEAELNAAREEKEALAQQAAPAPAAEPVAAPAVPQGSYKSRMEEELEAYRRAERTERYARERAQQLYHQVNGALADATAKVDDTARHVGQMTDKVVAQLAELQDAVTESKQALRDAAATMYTIRPYGEEN